MRLERPSDLGAVLRALEAPGGMLVGGGTAVSLLLKHRLVDPDRLIALGGVRDLSAIEERGGDLVIGATTTLAAIAAAPRVRAGFPTLAVAAGRIGNPRVRAVATLGGHLAHADPRQDLPPVLLGLGAAVVVAGPRGRREVPMSRLAVGFMETSLEDDEVILAVRVPRRRPGARGASVRFTPVSEEDYPTVAVAVEVVLDEREVVAEARVAIGGAGPTALLVEEAGTVLEGRVLDATARAAAGAEVARRVSPVDDQRGSADYKTAMAELWTRRALGIAARGTAAGSSEQKG